MFRIWNFNWTDGFFFPFFLCEIGHIAFKCLFFIVSESKDFYNFDNFDKSWHWPNWSRLNVVFICADNFLILKHNDVILIDLKISAIFEIIDEYFHHNFSNIQMKHLLGQNHEAVTNILK